MKNYHMRFRPYAPDQLFLLPPDLKQWLPEDDLVYFIIDIVNELNLDPIYELYDAAKGGQPPYNPRMMVGLLLYAYCMGMPSSRKIEQATYHWIPFRVLTANQNPDHDTIAEFRSRHLEALSQLFTQVLLLCRQAGLVKLGHVALDGTKVRANASRHKAMSYRRMQQKEAELKEQINALLLEAEACDKKEDALYGKGNRGDQLPEELRFAKTRLAKIREAKAALEQQAREQAKAQQAGFEAKKKAWDNRSERRGGRPPKAPSDKPKATAQRNFTDPDSRVMLEASTKSFQQCYNCQAAVDDKAQVIVATAVTQQPVDRQQLAPMIKKLSINTAGQMPAKLSADNGYYSEANCQRLQAAGIDPYIATGRVNHSDPPAPALRGRIAKSASKTERMARKLKTIKGRKIYSRRKHIVEPVFGQIKEVRGFRRFSFRGLKKVKAEWDLICLTHNLLKLFRANYLTAPA
jgi:transposase